MLLEVNLGHYPTHSSSLLEGYLGTLWGRDYPVPLSVVVYHITILFELWNVEQVGNAQFVESHLPRAQEALLLAGERASLQWPSSGTGASKIHFKFLATNTEWYVAHLSRNKVQNSSVFLMTDFSSHCE